MTENFPSDIDTNFSGFCASIQPLILQSILFLLKTNLLNLVIF